MANDEINKSRRRFLLGATTAVGAVGVVGAAVPFIGSWNPSAKAKAAGAPISVDISKLEFGQRLVNEWRGRPVWVVRRSEDTLGNLPSQDEKLVDPQSNKNQQPNYAKNEYRSVKPEILVLIGICTHLGCSPDYRPKAEPGEDWLGGFFCACHGSKFDLAGRVYKGSPASKNLEVPPHVYQGDNIIIIGVTPEEMA